MPDQLDPMQKQLELDLARDRARELAVKRAAEICMNKPPNEWDAAAQSAIELVAGNVRDAFAKQIKDTIKDRRQMQADIDARSKRK